MKNVTNTTQQVRIKLRHDLLNEYHELSEDALSYTLNRLLKSHIEDLKEQNEKANPIPQQN